MQSKTYNVKDPNNDREVCTIIGSCFTKNWIVLADSRNRKLKFLRNNREENDVYAITASCVFGCDIYDVCFLGNYRVAVALDDGFQFVRASKQVEIGLEINENGQVNRIHCGHRCNGINSRKNTIYAVDRQRLYAYNKENGEPMPGEIYFVAGEPELCKVSVSHKHNDNRIFLVNRRLGSECVIVLHHQEGQPHAEFLFTIMHNSLGNIRDVAFIRTPNSNWLVLILIYDRYNPFVWVSLSENNGYQICQNLQQPVTNVEHPLSLGCSKNGTIITGGQSNNFVKKVQLVAMLNL